MLINNKNIVKCIQKSLRCIIAGNQLVSLDTHLLNNKLLNILKAPGKI